MIETEILKPKLNGVKSKLQSFGEITHDTKLESLDVPTRLNELQSIQAGWLDGRGQSLDSSALEKLSQLFIKYYSSELPLPYTFPTENGGVQFEWRLSGGNPEIEIDLESMHGEWLSVDDESTIDLNSVEGWSDLIRRIAKIDDNGQKGNHS